MIILIHSSKTIRTPVSGTKQAGTPALLDKASELMERLKKLPAAQLAKVVDRLVEGNLQPSTIE